MDKILEFINDAKIFYFSTVEDNKPRVRPFGFIMKYNGSLYVATGKEKATYRQLEVNNNFEISATNEKNQWIRVKGIANIDSSLDVHEYAVLVAPYLKDMYNEVNKKELALYKLSNIDAEILGLDGTFIKL